MEILGLTEHGWAALPAMVRAVNTAVNLCRIWAEGAAKG